jgi:hypothetical protein
LLCDEKRGQDVSLRAETRQFWSWKGPRFFRRKAARRGRSALGRTIDGEVCKTKKNSKPGLADKAETCSNGSTIRRPMKDTGCFAPDAEKAKEQTPCIPSFQKSAYPL